VKYLLSSSAYDQPPPSVGDARFQVSCGSECTCLARNDVKYPLWSSTYDQPPNRCPVSYSFGSMNAATFAFDALTLPETDDQM
jgi:hypothetical protein